jgi:pimeloyl-ACP methyl ester carboxylesterase
MPFLRILIFALVCFVVVVLGFAIFQRKLLYYPTHHHDNNGLYEWRQAGRLIGYAREVPSPRNVWLLVHGNGGQAGDRAYALPSFSSLDSVFILEYPGYGARPGSPSMEACNAAAKEAYEILRARFPNTPVCVAGESIGSGPASALARNPHPPEKIVLILPFDALSHVAAHHFSYLPIGLMLRDKWNNIDSLKGYRGRVEIFGARDDTIIPILHARALAKSLPSATFHEIEGGHNDWATRGRVEIRNP